MYTLFQRDYFGDTRDGIQRITKFASALASLSNKKNLRYLLDLTGD
jgi:hypothetical protein